VKALEKISKTKTSFYIHDDIKERMMRLVPAGKQTEFVNGSLQTVLDAAEREKAKQSLIKILDSIKPVKRKETARQVIERSRRERDKRFNRILNIKKPKP